ncbi:MAG: nucleoside triphosphate pyrophosphohydrolase [Ignavibacteriales bacterium]|nr:nucleoside triphosphate pyrophosphohydrolase [Ignavibacteriales bacterium]
MTKHQSIGAQFEEYVAIIRRLRKDCPWDRQQTHESLRPHLIEEAYETVETIDFKNWHELKVELGDLLLHIILHTVMAEEEKSFALEDVLASAVDKMIRRHPHVFSDTVPLTADEVSHRWESLKMQEGRTSALDGVPNSLPGLLRAFRLQDKASKVGFDWNDRKDVIKKIHEEIGELEASCIQGDQNEMEREFGDLLFSLVNYARFLKINPEIALRHTMEKFSRRFRMIEEELRRQGKTPNDSSLAEMDTLWEEIKKKEKQ